MAAADKRRVSSQPDEIAEIPSQTDLLKILECPVCTEIPLAPIISCINGHNICNECRQKIAACGLCNAAFSKTRNFAIENIINSSRFACKYKEEGCLETIKGDVYRKHLRDCAKRPIVCKAKHQEDCRNKFIRIPVKGYLQHLKKVHNATGSIMTSSGANFIENIECLDKLRNWDPWPLYLDNLTFFRNQSCNSSYFSIWITLLGSEKDAANYRAEITINRENNLGSPIQWINLPVHSIYKEYTEIEAMSELLVVPKEVLKSFCKPLAEPMYLSPCNFEWNVNYRIWRVYHTQ